MTPAATGDGYAVDDEHSHHQIRGTGRENAVLVAPDRRYN
jgi:hypothetical protein